MNKIQTLIVHKLNKNSIHLLDTRYSFSIYFPSLVIKFDNDVSDDLTDNPEKIKELISSNKVNSVSGFLKYELSVEEYKIFEISTKHTIINLIINLKDPLNIRLNFSSDPLGIEFDPEYDDMPSTYILLHLSKGKEYLDKAKRYLLDLLEGKIEMGEYFEKVITYSVNKARKYIKNVLSSDENED